MRNRIYDIYEIYEIYVRRQFTNGLCRLSGLALFYGAILLACALLDYVCIAQVTEFTTFTCAREFTYGLC